MRNRIRELRIEKGLRQKDVAALLGISAQSFCFYENWVNKPDPETLCKIADIFEVSVDYLLCREDDDGYILRGYSEYSEDEQTLIEEYRALPAPLKSLAQQTLQAWNNANHK